MNKIILPLTLLGILAFAGIWQILEKHSASDVVYPVATYQPGEHLFPIFYANRWGFINLNGAIVIQPQYRNVGNFVNGLAPARLRGTYGFINYAGAFSIADTYDYALDFSEGMARVWKDGQCFFIDEKGRQSFQITFKEATDFKRGLAKIYIEQAQKKRVGLLSKQGKWILEPTFGAIMDFSEGYAVVYGPDHHPNQPEGKSEVGLIDRAGRWVVPFGKYMEIYSFQNGYAEVEYPSQDKEWGRESAYIDSTGQIVLYLPAKVSKSISPLNHYVSEGVLGVSFAKKRQEPNDIEEFYTAFIDLKGQVVLSNPEYDNVYPFREERSFAGSYNSYRLIDKKGNILSKESFSSIQGDGFEKGVALVATQSQKWGLIDCNGAYVIPPTYDQVHPAGFQSDELLVAMIDTTYKDPKPSADGYEKPHYRWGLVDRKGKWLVKPLFSQVSNAGFQSDRLYVEGDSLYGYVDRMGKFVWKATVLSDASAPPKNLDTLNIDFMMRGYHYAFEVPHIPLSDQMSRTRHLARSIPANRHFSMSQLAVEVDVSQADTFAVDFVGSKVYVYNTNKDTVVLPAQDSRLYLKMQALNSKGVWQDIEYLPSSWCGNSYHNIRLAPRSYWEFTFPIYTGDFPTQLRLALTIHRSWKNEQLVEKTIYSNTFEGRVNPAQFWREQDYSPQGIMDPYLN